MPDVREVGFAVTETDVTLTTTTENVAVSSGPVTLPTQTVQVLIIAWAQLTTGAGTTAVTPRIRRGTAITGTLVGEANNVTTPASETHQFQMIATEARAGEGSVEYSLTLDQVGATADGTVLQAGIVVLIL